MHDPTAAICHAAVDAHRQLAALDSSTHSTTYTARPLLVGQILAFTSALCHIHDWNPTLEPGAAHATILDWWLLSHPEDWSHDPTINAALLRYELAALLHTSPYRTPHLLAAALNAPSSTTHRAFVLPERTGWRTLAPFIDALHGDLARLNRLWLEAQPRRT